MPPHGNSSIAWKMRFSKEDLNYVFFCKCILSLDVKTSCLFSYMFFFIFFHHVYYIIMNKTRHRMTLALFFPAWIWSFAHVHPKICATETRSAHQISPLARAGCLGGHLGGIQVLKPLEAALRFIYCNESWPNHHLKWVETKNVSNMFKHVQTTHPD